MNKQEVIGIFKELLHIFGDCVRHDAKGFCTTHWLHAKEECPMFIIRNILEYEKKVKKYHIDAEKADAKSKVISQLLKDLEGIDKRITKTVAHMVEHMNNKGK